MLLRTRKFKAVIYRIADWPNRSENFVKQDLLHFKTKCKGDISFNLIILNYSIHK